MGDDQKDAEGFVEILRDALDRPIAFHRTFVKLTGSVTAALMLSQAMYWSKRVNSNDEGRFYKTREQWEEETGLSRFEQEGARKTLRKFSFWKEELRGVPAKMHYRVDMSALSKELLNNADRGTLNEKSNKNVRLLKSSKQGGVKPASKHAENQQPSSLKTSEHYKGVSKTTAEIKTTTPEPSRSDPAGGRASVEKLLNGTVLHAADSGIVLARAEKYNRTLVEIEKIIDVYDQQYRKSGKIEDATGLIVGALMNGIPDPPEGYVPKAQREADAKQRRDAAKRKADEERTATDAENKALEEAMAKLDALPKNERETLLAKAKKKLPASLRNSIMAVKTEAIRMMIEESQSPERKGW